MQSCIVEIRFGYKGLRRVSSLGYLTTRYKSITIICYKALRSCLELRRPRRARNKRNLSKLAILTSFEVVTKLRSITEVFRAVEVQPKKNCQLDCLSKSLQRLPIAQL